MRWRYSLVRGNERRRKRNDWNASDSLAMCPKDTRDQMDIDYRFQPKGLKSDLGWYSRGYLPHFDGGQIPQFLTFRLCDSLPQSVLKKWKQTFEGRGEEGKIVFRKKLEKFLDAGDGECHLR